MINNRQNGRRRGRGGGPRSPNQSPNPGNNRQENRSRGNASQLLEKYKSLARDAQLQGDRVQAEYYLQFADHYFRVLNENRARFEEQRRQRDDYSSDEDEDQDEASSASGDDEREERGPREYREDRTEGRRPRFEERGETRADRNGEVQAERPAPDREEAREDRGGETPRPRRSRRRETVEEDRDEERISLDVLPPAISADNDAPVKASKRRTRRPREGDEEIAPAA